MRRSSYLAKERVGVFRSSRSHKAAHPEAPRRITRAIKARAERIRHNLPLMAQADIDVDALDVLAGLVVDAAVAEPTGIAEHDARA